INLLPGEVYYTDKYDTGVPTGGVPPTTPLQKPAAIYYAPYFDWEIVWGSSIYRSVLEENFDMPTLYQIDLSLSRTMDITKNDGSGRVLSVIDEMRHVGHSSLGISNVTFNITHSGGWTVSDISAFQRNNTETFPINITSSSVGDGYFTVLIDNVSVMQNELIYLRYTLSRGKEANTVKYPFNAYVTAYTKSGTPVEKSLYSERTVPGISEGGGGAGGGGGTVTPAEEMLEIIAIDSKDTFITDSMLQNNVTFRIIDTGQKGLRDPLFYIYIPKDSGMDVGKISLRLTRNNVISKLKFLIKSGGVKKIGSEEYREYILDVYSVQEAGSKSPTDLAAFINDDVIEISYSVDTAFGTSTLITRAYGYDYYEDRYLFEDVFTTVRREYWKTEDLLIREGPWEPLEIEVGKPVRWLKSIEVYNPNDRRVKERYAAKVYEKHLGAHVSKTSNLSTQKIDLDDEGSSVSFLIDIGEDEWLTYTLEITTAPALETERSTELVGVTEGDITFMTLLTVKNFAELDYSNVSLLFPTKKIVNCSHEYAPTEDGIRINIPLIRGNESISLTVTYVEVPPKIILDLSHDEHECGEGLKLGVIVVPYDTKGYLELELTGPGGNTNTVYADIIPVDEIPKQSIIEIPTYGHLAGNYTLNAYYQSNFQTLCVNREVVSIVCDGSREIPWIFYLFLIIIILLIAKRSVYTKRTLDREIRRLK
ncbi:MAG: hypothetical protein ACP5E4_01200, partial [Candidatus Aenigmatarchaeota archaeon]